METISVDISDKIALITLNRPEKMNAYNRAMHHELVEAIKSADADPSVRVIVMNGAGRAYCAGADISDGFGSVDEGVKLDGIERDFGGMLVLTLFECDTPIIAAVNGAAVGIGATQLLPMDIIIAEEGGKFAFPFSRRGIVFDGAASFFLPRIVGLGKAREWILKGEIFRAEEAKEAGFVHEIVGKGEALNRAMALAQDIAQNVSPASAAQNKQLLRASILNDADKYGGGPMSAHMRESKILEKAFTSADCFEGVKSFLEKRAPDFQDYKKPN